MATTKKVVRNESPFQGWVSNGKYRFEWKGSGQWFVYEKHGNAYIKTGSVSAKRNASARDLLLKLDD